MVTKKNNFNIMAFPNGPICNLDCDYCYYLDKTSLYRKSENFQMSEKILEKYIKQYFETHSGPKINFNWQGGEPTLRGLDFFEKVIEFQNKYLPKGWQFQNSLQTNAIFLNDKWCDFLKKNNFLVGVSLDGPRQIHDYYRKDKKGRATHQRVMQGINLLKKHNVNFNVLCVVNNLNSQKPLEIYNYFKKLGVEYIQFIPLIEVDHSENNLEGIVSSYSVRAEDYGDFLIEIFEEWVRKDLGKIFVQIFEEALAAWAGQNSSLCIFSRTCGDAAVMEHNGDFYSCDHFVFPEYKLGNINHSSLTEMLQSNKQTQFGRNKLEELPQYCIKCKYKFFCNGGCPKNRINDFKDKGESLNYLCSGYKKFFAYIDSYLKQITKSLSLHQPLEVIRNEMKKFHKEVWNVGRNDACPCGSGQKFKKCCQNQKNEKSEIY